MIVRYWQPFQEVETLRRQLDQVFEDITNVVDPSTTTWTPAIRLVESGDTYRLTAQLAGVNADDLDVQVTRESVLLSGKRQVPEIAECDRILYENIHYGAFQRVVKLPDAVQNDAVTAEFNQGLLTLTLPKVEAARNKVVKINLGQLGSETHAAIATQSTPEEAETIQ